jgi:hypothetical protein
MPYCRQCHKMKSNDDFHKIEDRSNGFYAFCKSCMDEQGRSLEYPPIEKRGYGVYYPNFASLEPGFRVDR